MGAPSVGDVVLVPFPFSDLSQSKVRPAVVLADVGRSDWLLCQITSNPYGDPNAILLATSDLSSGNLLRTSFARPGKLFTANSALIIRTIGHLTAPAFCRLLDCVVDLIRPPKSTY
jgi:mRNA interferase MazF